MKTNDILYKIKKALSLTQEEILEVYKLVDYSIDASQLDSLLKRKQDKTFKICTYEELGLFLDGLVIFKRGPSPKKNDANEMIELTNNLILKKLRITLELKEPEIEIIFSLGDVTLTKQQLASLFRKENHKNFKICSDELLMAFLDGMDEFYFTGEEE
ncbi:MAG: DUF1456 family protein [Campylobacterota bacterium]|nr:DUF1456 family protein [Campylobacterota bacterium]